MEYIFQELGQILGYMSALFFDILYAIIAIYAIHIMRELNIFLKNKNQNNIIKHYE